MTHIRDYILITFYTILVGIGVSIIQTSSLMAGGTVGLSVLLHYLTNIKLGWLMIATSLPFYLLSWVYIGKQFTIRNAYSVISLSIGIEYVEKYLSFDTGITLLNAIIAGSFMGIGFALMIKRNASFGAILILAVFLQQRKNWNKTTVLIMVDVCILGTSMFFFDRITVLYSFVAVVTMSLFLNNKKRKTQKT